MILLGYYIHKAMNVVVIGEDRSSVKKFAKAIKEMQKPISTTCKIDGTSMSSNEPFYARFYKKKKH